MGANLTAQLYQSCTDRKAPACAAFLMQSDICAEYHKKLMQTLLPRDFRRSSGQDFAALYKV